MTRYRLSREARNDLDDILDYLDTQSQAASSRVESQLIESFKFLAENPSAGHLRQDLTDIALRFWPVGKYLIVYIPQTRPLKIAAILHGARDIENILQDRMDD